MTVLSKSELQNSEQLHWKTIVLVTLAFWLSGSLLLDLLVMPSLYVTGMMTQPDFPIASYSLFWVFNRVELLCAAIAVTGVLAIRHNLHRPLHEALLLVIALLTIVLIFTYGLTPEMSAIGVHLNWFETSSAAPAAMNQMHGVYWVLELIKLAASGTLLGLIYRQEV